MADDLDLDKQAKKMRLQIEAETWELEKQERLERLQARAHHNALLQQLLQARAHHNALLQQDPSTMTSEQRAFHKQQIQWSQQFLDSLKQDEQQQQVPNSTATTSAAVQGLHTRFHSRDVYEKVKLATALVLVPDAMQQLQQQHHDIDSKQKQQPSEAQADPPPQQQQPQPGPSNEQHQQLDESYDRNSRCAAAATGSGGTTSKAAVGVCFWVHPKVAVTANHILEGYEGAESISVAVQTSGGLKVVTLKVVSRCEQYDYAVLVWEDGAVDNHMPLYQLPPEESVSVFSCKENTLVGFQIGLQQDLAELLKEYGLKAPNTLVGTAPAHISKVFSEQQIALHTANTWRGCCGSVIASPSGAAIAFQVATANSWLDGAKDLKELDEVAMYLQAATESLSEMKVAVLAAAFQDDVEAAIGRVVKAAAATSNS